MGPGCRNLSRSQQCNYLVAGEILLRWDWQTELTRADRTKNKQAATEPDVENERRSFRGGMRACLTTAASLNTVGPLRHKQPRDRMRRSPSKLPGRGAVVSGVRNCYLCQVRDSGHNRLSPGTAHELKSDPQIIIATSLVRGIR